MACPDKFRGTLSAAAASAAIATGLRRAGYDEVTEIPMADGGEGSLETIRDACGGAFRTTGVTGPLGAPVEPTPWMGSRPCFADSRPVIGRAPGLSGLWLAYGHAHWGLTLGPVTGRLVADMMTGTTPFCDPAPYRAERFGN